MIIILILSEEPDGRDVMSSKPFDPIGLNTDFNYFNKSIDC